MVTEYGMGTELQSKQLPADDYSMSDAHAPDRRRGAAVHHRPGPPARAQARGREPRRCSRRSPSRCSRTRCSSATTSSSSWPPTGATPAARSSFRREDGAGRRAPTPPSPSRARLAPRLRLRARVRADRSHRSGRGGPRRAGRALPRPAGHGRAAPRDRRGVRRGGRAARDRRRARGAAEPRPTPRAPSAKFLERNGPGLHHVAYQTDDIDSALETVRDGRACG